MPFHGMNRGSNPRGDASKKPKGREVRGPSAFYWRLCEFNRAARFDQRSDQWEERAGRPQGETLTIPVASWFGIAADVAGRRQHRAPDVASVRIGNPAEAQISFLAAVNSCTSGNAAEQIAGDGAASGAGDYGSGEARKWT